MHGRASIHGLATSWDVEYPAGVILNPRLYSATNRVVTPLHNTVASVGRPATALFPWRTYRRTLEYDSGRWNAVNADPAGENAGKPIEFLIAWTINEEDELRCLAKLGVWGTISDSPELLARVLGRGT